MAEGFPIRDVGRRSRTTKEVAGFLFEKAADIAKGLAVAAFITGVSVEVLERFLPEPEKATLSEAQKKDTPSVEDVVCDALVAYYDQVVEVEQDSSIHKTESQSSVLPVDLEEAPQEEWESPKTTKIKEITASIAQVLGKAVLEKEDEPWDPNSEDLPVQKDLGDAIVYSVIEGEHDSNDEVEPIIQVELTYEDLNLGTLAANADGTYLYSPVRGHGQTLLLKDSQELQEAVREVWDNSYRLQMASVPPIFLSPEDRPSVDEVEQAKAYLAENTRYLGNL